MVRSGARGGRSAGRPRGGRGRVRACARPGCGHRTVNPSGPPRGGLVPAADIAVTIVTTYCLLGWRVDRGTGPRQAGPRFRCRALPGPRAPPGAPTRPDG
ncbi:hypothetical protein BJF79_46155 [Actinomadura sp. CNU-125]|nr:hypothetical protein BJF79_46155 [Actinomadura sp. CNU-125]